MTIDRLAAAFSRRRLIGAGLFAALSALVADDAEARCSRRHPCTPTPEETATDAPTEAPTDVPTDVPTETAVPTEEPTPTDAPTEAPTATEAAVPTNAPTDIPNTPPAETPEATSTPTPAPTQTPSPSATATTSATDPSPTPVPTPPGSADGVIVSRYRIDASVPGTPPYRLMAYRPGAMRGTYRWTDATWGARTITGADRYERWDVLTAPNLGLYRAYAGDFMRFRLNRPATVAVVWRYLGSPPSWLASWTPDGTVREDNFGGRTYPVFRKAFGAGGVVLPGVGGGDAKDVFLVLLADGGGNPYVVRDGTVAPNETCPPWVHDAYAGGWHPEIDPVWWCYHRHEHGSAPVVARPYGDLAAAAGMPEAHPGFKTYVFDDWQGHTWQVTHHFGTAGRARVCNRFHTLELMVWDGSGNLLIDYRFMADFGASVDNDNAPYSPADCPDQASLMVGHFGKRMIPRVGGVGYEPWGTAWPVAPLGITGTFSVNTRDQITRCDDLACAAVVPAVNEGDGSPNSGTSRFLAMGNFAITPPRSGEWCTDAMATTVLDCSSPGAVRQYAAGVAVATGVDNPDHTAGCYAPDAWGDPHVCEAFVRDAPLEREDSIPTGGPN